MIPNRLKGYARSYAFHIKQMCVIFALTKNFIPHIAK